MKVALVQQHVDPLRGGAEASTLEMARHLARAGVEVTLIYSSGDHALRQQEGVTLLPLERRGLTRVSRTLRFLQAVRRVCQIQRFDVVHAITPCLTADVYQPRGGTYAETIERSLAPVPSGLARGLRRVGRRFNINQRFLHRVEHSLLGKYRRRIFVAALSDYVRRQVEFGAGFPAERIRVIFNGVDIEPLSGAERSEQRRELRSGLGLAEDAPLVLFAAHNFRLKGLGELLRAMAVPARDGLGQEWTLVVAGRDRPDRYQRRARALGVAARVRFVGTRTPVRLWYAAADVLAHPTWYDPCSRVVLEALSLGLPVVTTRYNGAAEVVHPDRHGVVLAEPDDVDALAGAVERVLASDMAERCRADAGRLAEQLSMARHARELKSLYEDVLRARQRPTPAARS